MTTITRQNWREHTTEPPLTADERKRVREIRYACRENEDLRYAVYEATSSEWTEVQATGVPFTGWAGFVAWVNATRRLQRAEVKAWEEILSYVTFVTRNK